MQLLLLGFLGLVLLIFCVVDLWHLKEMLKCMRGMLYFLENIESIDRERYVNGK